MKNIEPFEQYMIYSTCLEALNIYKNRLDSIHLSEYNEYTRENVIFALEYVGKKVKEYEVADEYQWSTQDVE